MRESVFPMMLTVGGAVLYQVSSKSVPRTVHPLVAIIAAYLTAIVLCLCATWKWPVTGAVSESLRQFNWGVAGIGLGAALIEVGFLLAYRAGWPLNLASIIVNVSAAVVLLPLGLAMFGERLTLAKGLGAALCLIGLVLISRD
jgi:uncharacterized membrane protein